MKLRTKFLAAAISGFAATSAYADAIIDLFDDPDPARILQINDAVTVMATDGAFASILGGYRDVVLTGNPVTDPNVWLDGGTAKLTVGGGTNALRFSNDDGVYSTATIQWDGNADAANVSVLDTVGLGGVNLLADGDRFFASIAQADLGFEYNITVWDMDGDYSTLYSGSLFSVTNYDTHWMFSWFNLGTGDHEEEGLPFYIDQSGNVDFSNIGAIQLQVAVPESFIGALDLRIDSVSNVPEPSSLALLGLGLLGLGVTARRKLAA